MIALALLLAATTPETALSLISNPMVSAQDVRATLPAWCEIGTECFENHWQAFGRLHRTWETAKPRQRAKIEKLVRENMEPGWVDWSTVATVSEYRRPSPAPGVRTTVHCSTHVSKHGRHAWTHCW